MNDWPRASGMASSAGMGAGRFFSEAHAVLVEAAVAGFAGSWSAARHEACDGELIMVVLPEDDDLATFSVDATVAGFDLSVLRDDALLPCGRFDAIRELIAALRDLAESEAAGRGFRRI